MNGRFMQLWLQNERAKGASPSALPANFGADTAAAAGKAAQGALARHPALVGGPPSPQGESILSNVQAELAKLKTPKLDAMTAPPAPAFDSRAYAAEAARQVAAMPTPKLDKLAGKGPEEGSLEWFDQATPEEMRELVDRTRSMVKIGR